MLQHSIANCLNAVQAKMIKVALEDALTKLKDHFHGEKHS